MREKIGVRSYEIAKYGDIYRIEFHQRIKNAKN